MGLASLTGRRWLVLVGVVLAMPLLWFDAVSALVAIQPLSASAGGPSRVPDSGW
jgi:hypothetical protein